MKLSLLAITAAVGLTQAVPKHTQHRVRASTVQGFDISNHQEEVDFQAAYDSGARFVMIKSTEGTSFTDPCFSSHYTGATNANLLRGGYHFALPDVSPASDQVSFFLENGGDWSADERTLPGMLDIEYNPYGETCYGLSAEEMTSWIREFVDEYHASTGRYPMIYTTADWWSRCTGDAAGFGSTCPLVLAAYSSSAPSTIPGDWETYTIWQNSDAYEFGGDSDVFNGGFEQLVKIASGN